MKQLFSWLKQHTILYNLTIIALVFFGVAVLSFLAMMFGTRHGVSRTVPDFKGLRLADAEYYASRRGLHIVVNDSLFVPAYPGGVVLEQLPKGGVSVKPGRKVYVTINSFCQPQVPVPYVAGRSLRQAKNMLEAAGLTIAELEYVEDIATNYVLAEFLDGVEVEAEQDVKAERGSGVVLRVGMAAGQGTTGVPQLLGRTLVEARSRIWESGLNVGSIAYDDGLSPLDQGRARVYWQSQVAGAGAMLGGRVALSVTLDEAKVQGALAEYERYRQQEAQLKHEADSLAAVRAKDSLARLQAAPAQGEDNFFF